MTRPTFLNILQYMVTSLRLPFRSRVITMLRQPPLIGKADIASIADNEMVKDTDTQYLPCRHQSRSQDTIFLAWCRIAAGMVVQKNHGRRRFLYRE